MKVRIVGYDRDLADKDGGGKLIRDIFEMDDLSLNQSGYLSRGICAIIADMVSSRDEVAIYKVE